MTEEKILLQENIFKQKILMALKLKMFFYNKYLNNPFISIEFFIYFWKKRKCYYCIQKNIFKKYINNKNY